MNRKRIKKYRRLREIRQERDYQIGLIQYANRPFTFRPLTLPRKALTTTSFVKKMNILI